MERKQWFWHMTAGILAVVTISGIGLQTGEVLAMEQKKEPVKVDSSLQYHMATAKKNGVTREEMVQAITQLGFYAGWPKAWAAFRYAKEVYGNE